MIELLAGVPSVIYGFCGLFLSCPSGKNLEMKLDVAPYGVGIFTASLVLSIMIIPYFGLGSDGRSSASFLPISKRRLSRLEQPASR